jgi:hypothetical protein
MDGENLIAEMRAEALKTALSLPTPDAVYEVVRFNEWRFQKEAYRIGLEELLSKDSLSVLIEWQKRAYLLRNAAYPVGDAGLRDDGSHASARARFEETNPGFGKRSYDSAESHGWFMAR